MYTVIVYLLKSKGGDLLGNKIKLKDIQENNIRDNENQLSALRTNEMQGKDIQEDSIKNDKKGNDRDRIWEIDFFRCIALLLMVYFHLIFDLKDIYGYNIDYTKGFNAFTGRAAGTLFILISGISCTFSRSNIKRGLKILALAMLITLATYFYNIDMTIKFGVLHFLGVSILLYSLLEKININLLVIIGTIIFILGNMVKNVTTDFDYFFVLGITSNNFISADYYPLIPWLGVFIYGIVIGKLLYKDKKSVFRFSINNNIISWVGKHTLSIYIIHQPLIIIIIGLIGKTRV